MIERLTIYDKAILGGAAAMAVGTFLPIVRLSVFGTMNYLRGDGIFILILSAVIVPLVAFGYRRVAAAAGTVAIAIMLSTIVKLLDGFGKFRSGAPNGLTDVFAQGVGLEWGWLALIGGALTVVAAGLMTPKEGPAQIIPAKSDDDGSRADEVISRYLQGRGQIFSAAQNSEQLGQRFGKRAAPSHVAGIGVTNQNGGPLVEYGGIILFAALGLAVMVGIYEWHGSQPRSVPAAPIVSIPPSEPVVSGAPQPEASGMPKSADSGITRGADLYAGFDRLIGQRVRVRGKIFAASATGGSFDGALFESDGASFVIRQVSADVMRRLLKGCSVRECMGTLDVVPASRENGDAFPRLTNPIIIENK